jgi:hypothetical protein
MYRVHGPHLADQDDIHNELLDYSESRCIFGKTVVIQSRTKDQPSKQFHSF